MGNCKLVIFNLNGENFGIEITQVDTIIEPMEIFKIPSTPIFIEGLINLRGKVYTVFNLRKKFNLPTKEFDDNTKIIIVNVDSTMVGLIVDEVMEIATFDENNIESAPQSILSLDRKFINGIAKKDEKIVLILDLNRIISLNEEATV